MHGPITIIASRPVGVKRRRMTASAKQSIVKLGRELMNLPEADLPESDMLR